MFYALSALSVALSATAIIIDANYPSTPLDNSYDFIVVGAGVGGSVMASRLSENADFKVLLIEAGGSDFAVPESAVPVLAPALAPDFPYLWNYVVAPQKGLANRVFPYPRGKVCGGSSTLINKGTSQEWDRLARVTGDHGWGWSTMKKYLNKFEGFVQPRDGHDVTGQYTPSAHGKSGPILTTINNYLYPTDNKLIAAANDQFPFNEDVNAGGSGLGIGFMPFAMGGGYRNSASVSYLHMNNATDRPNLTVLLNAQVTRLVYHHSSRYHVSGIVWSTAFNGTSTTTFASKEVILSAGAVNTPQILMLSGIGPKKALQTLDIPSIKDLPVGQFLQDHPLLTTIWEVTPGADTFDGDLFDPTIRNADLLVWERNRTGRASEALGGVAGWSRLPNNDPIWKKYEDPSAGDHVPHMESAWADGWLSASEMPPTGGKYMTVVHALVSPSSRGQITLASKNPWDAPIIDPGLVNDELDRHQILRNIVKVRDFVENAATLKGFLGDRWGANKAASTLEQIDEYITNYTTTIWHPSSSASMKAKGVTSGVVNADLTVQGISGLRVVDLSVFPWVPSGHPQGYLYGLSERAADLVKAKYASRADSFPYRFLDGIFSFTLDVAAIPFRTLGLISHSEL